MNETKKQERDRGNRYRLAGCGMLFLGLCLWTILAEFPSAQECETPKLHLSKEVWDFGTIQRGEEATYPLVMTNMGKGKLHITQIRSSCTTCSVVEGYQTELGPGESTELTVTFKAEGRKGKVTKTVYIDSDDPEEPRQVFRITGFVVRSEAPEIVVSPNPWYADSISLNPEKWRDLVITNDGLSNLLVESAEGMGCVVQDTLLPIIGPGDSALIRVGFDLKSLAWEEERYVLFHSNDPYQPDFKVMIFGESASRPTPDTTRVCALLFVSKGCTECTYVMDKVITPLQKRYPQFQVRTALVDDPANYDALTALERRFEDTGNEIPVLFVDTFVLGGKREIESALESRIRDCLKKGGCKSVKCEKGTRVEPKSVKEPIYIAYFFQPGCKQCDRVCHMLRSLQKRYEKLHINQFNIGTIENKITNEAIGELLDVPDEKRLLAPALAVGDQYFVQHEITDERVESAIEGLRDSGSLCSWEEAENFRKEARLSIIERFKGLGPMTVVLGGLVDGINPCAFATIIFFLSYLAFVGRKGRELLYVGIAFTIAVFLTYLLVGVGLYHFVQSLKIFGIVSLVVYVLTAALAFILGTYSVYDIIKIKRGREKEITLQLPDFLKKRIHKTIRERTRMRRYILAAFITGWVVSLLELACTGQVYLPTICFVTGVPELRLHAIFYLVLYNLMFIFPLCLVFGLAYFGTTSEQIAAVMKRRIIWMKVALAFFFFCLGGFLLSVIF